MNFIFFTNIAFEDWNWDNSITKGIGGSETSIVEMSWRLARRGHKVTVYAPIPKNSPHEWRGTHWYRYEEADFTKKGVWILYRCPSIVDKFPPITKRKDQQIWFLMQDWDYPDWDRYIKNTDKVITLCQSHGKYTLDKHPKIGSKLWLTSNGIKVDLIEEIEKEQIQRNPARIMHASSPDRGLKQAILIYRKAREYVPNLELHAFYGFDNLSKLIKGRPHSALSKEAKEIMRLIKETKGVIFHGRVSQNELYREWFKSGIYLYITNFFETSNIASQEAQAMGAVPVFSPIFAQGENIKYGIAIEGEKNDDLTIARASAEVVRLALQPGLQEEIRHGMIKWARERFNWERFVTQWGLEAEGKRKYFEENYGFPGQVQFITIREINRDDPTLYQNLQFQEKHAKGRILNIGSDGDLFDFKKKGAVNVDIFKVHPRQGYETKADIIADVRDLPKKLHKQFDTVLLGDVLEHMNFDNGVKSLENCRRCLATNGKVIVTCPNDTRGMEDNNDTYPAGMHAKHRPIPKSELMKMIRKSGLKQEKITEIDYLFFKGFGVICSL